MPKLMMIQPGAFGDIITCAPIAKKYSDAGYDVYWPMRIQFMDLASRLDYISRILLDEEVLDDDWLRSDVIKCLRLYEIGDYDYGLNLADRGPHPTAELPGETNQEAKYRLSNIPFDDKHTLTWARNEKREDALYCRLVEPEEKYVLCGLQSSDGKIEMPIEPGVKMVEMKWIPGYTIFDWYKLVKNAQAIYSVESSFHCFVDGIIHEVDCPKYCLARTPGMSWTVSKYWDKKYFD
jgi:hypothetical protein